MALRDVLMDELKDLYSAEKQLIKSLPKMAKGAEDEELKTSILQHLEETKGQAVRIEQAFEALGEKAKAKHCKGMEGVIEEGKEALEEDEEGAAADVMICGASLRVEHYEIAGYTAAIAIARALGEDEAADLLEQNLQEEQATAEKLTAKGEALMEQAASEGESDSDEEDDEPVSIAPRKSAAKKSAKKAAKKAAKKSSR